MIKLVRNFEYIKLPIKCTLGHSAVVRTDGSDVSPAEITLLAIWFSKTAQNSRHAVGGFQERGHLETCYSRPQ